VHEGGRGCFIAARSTSLGVLHRVQRISSQGKPPLTAWSIVGDGSIGSPSLHIRSFQLSQSNRSARLSMTSLWRFLPEARELSEGTSAPGSARRFAISPGC
jgi:hypothetical protein